MGDSRSTPGRVDSDEIKPDIADTGKALQIGFDRGCQSLHLLLRNGLDGRSECGIPA